MRCEAKNVNKQESQYGEVRDIPAYLVQDIPTLKVDHVQKVYKRDRLRCGRFICRVVCSDCPQIHLFSTVHIYLAVVTSAPLQAIPVCSEHNHLDSSTDEQIHSTLQAVLQESVTITLTASLLGYTTR